MNKPVHIREILPRVMNQILMRYFAWKIRGELSSEADDKNSSDEPQKENLYERR
jgi:hypothetical protein